MARKSGSCDDGVLHTEVTQREPQAELTQQQLHQTSVEVQDGNYKWLEECTPVDLFNAHLQAKKRAAAHMRSAEFLLAASEYYKKLSGVQ